MIKIARSEFRKPSLASTTLVAITSKYHWFEIVVRNELTNDNQMFAWAERKYCPDIRPECLSYEMILGDVENKRQL